MIHLFPSGAVAIDLPAGAEILTLRGSMAAGLVRPGDRVIARSGAVPVLAVSAGAETGAERTVRLELSRRAVIYGADGRPAAAEARIPA